MFFALLKLFDLLSFELSSENCVRKIFLICWKDLPNSKVFNDNLHKNYDANRASETQEKRLHINHHSF